MKKKYLLSVLLIVAMITLTAVGITQKIKSNSVETRAEALLESKHTLRFNDNGQFKILVFADLHLNSSGINEYMDGCIKMLIDREQPDLVILTGDNVADSGITSDEVFKATLNGAMDYLESKKIPWMHVYGNHDSEGSYTREQQQRVYESFDYCVSKTGEDITGVGNYVLPIYSSKEDKVKFTVWVIPTSQSAFCLQRAD